MSKDASSPSRLSRRLVWLVLLAGLVVLLLWAGLKAWRVYQASQSLLGRQAAAETLLSGGITNLDPAAAADLVYGIRGDVVVLRDELGILMPILPYLGWVPQAGPLLTAVPELMEMADAGTEAAAYAFRGLQPALVILQDEDAANRIPQLVQILDQAKGDLNQASLAMDRVVAARTALGDTSTLPWRVQQLLLQIDPWLPRGQDGLKLALIAPDLLGAPVPRIYIILAQNEDELRPTGGFISGAGLLTVYDGTVVDLEFKDASLINDVTAKPYDEYPPEPLHKYMLLDYFLLRDSNYWPDFPVSAQKALDLYSYGEDISRPDGVIAINQQFLKALVGATGPISVAETGETITRDNVIASIQDAWTLEEGVLERKSFLSTFAESIRDQIETRPDSIDPQLLIENLFAAAAAKDLQVYVTDPAVQAVLDTVGWNGRIPPPRNNDAFTAVDTSIGYNKANLFIERSIEYAVDLSTGTPQARLAITHIHTDQPDDAPCLQGSTDVYVERGGYLALADGCYWNYLRVYVPEGSDLTSGSEHTIPGDSWFSGIDLTSTTEVYNELPGHTTFANYMLVGKGQQVTSTYDYLLPANVIQKANGRSQYRLVVYNQAGIRPHPLKITIALPPGAELLNTQPAPTAVTGSTLEFELTLAANTELIVDYR